MNHLDLLTKPKEPPATRRPPSPPADKPTPQEPVKVCTHPRAVPGLDACYCPDCKRSINAGTNEYNELLQLGVAKLQRSATRPL